jgi:hypothetical protein
MYKYKMNNMKGSSAVKTHSEVGNFLLFLLSLFCIPIKEDELRGGRCTTWPAPEYLHICHTLHFYCIFAL